MKAMFSVRTVAIAATCLTGTLTPLHAASDVTVGTGTTAGGAFAGTNPSIFTPTAATAVANTTTIQTALNGGNAVTINTASAAGGNGDLTVANPVSKTAGASALLTFNAVRDLSFNTTVSSSSGPLPLALIAGRNISNSQTLTSNGGDITLSPTQTFSVGSAISAGTGQLTIQSGSVESTNSYSLTGSSVTVAPAAALRISGTVNGPLTIGGTISPKPAGETGGLQVNGALIYQATATHVVDLGGTSEANTFDRINSTGAVTVAGSLQVNLVNSFHDTISGASVFTILRGSSISGTFSGYPNGSRITLANDYGSLRVNYTATTVTLDDWQPVIVDLTWDPGTADGGTQIFSNINTRSGRHYFRILTQTTDIGAWRSRLTLTTGEAALYLSKSNLPLVNNSQYSSIQTGSDGLVLRDDQFNPGEEWYLLVYATAGAQWNLFSGRAFVNDLGPLPFTDSNSNSQYDIGEAVAPQTAPAAPMPPEGIRFYKSTIPVGTPAWSLWLNGSTRDIALRTTKVPFHVSTNYYTRKQSGQMLVVPTVLGTGANAYLLSVVAPQGESIGLDSRIQTVSDIAFTSTSANIAVSGPPYRVFRTSVPIDQLAWDISTTAVAGNPNVCVRKGNVPAEWDNEAVSEAVGSATDSITLVPDYLTNGTWFITVYGTGNYTFSLKSGNPVITPMNFTDLKTNDQTNRAGWRYYALTDIPSQVGSLGWELLLSAQAPGTQIAIRRNKVPSRWSYRANGYTGVPSDIGTTYIDYLGINGFLQRPGHQADVWYVGIYSPQLPLGPFVLEAHPIAPATVGYTGSNTVVTGLEPGRWEFQRIDVPAGIVGWDVNVTGVSGGNPQLVIRRDQLPQAVSTLGWSYPNASNTWPSGNSWSAENDWTNRPYNAGSGDYLYYRRLVMGSNGPLEPGSYYVGVYNADPNNPTSYTLSSRGIGSGQTIPVGTLGYTAGSNVVISNLPPREAAYYKVTIPSSVAGWEFTFTPSAGEMMMCVRRGTIPDFRTDYEYTDIQQTSFKEEVRIQKSGPERFVLLPSNNQDFIQPDDYYIAVISEGVSPADASHTGTGTSSGVLASNGPLISTPLGTATLAGITQPVSLESGQLKNYSFTVPAGTASLEVRLDNRTGNPNMGLISGTRIATRYPGYGANAYGYGGGQISGTVTAYDDDLITVANPAAGSYNITLRADPLSGNYPAATADLVIIANAPVPVAFDGSSTAISNQAGTAWRYFQVTVPPGVLGWDVRVKNVTGTGNPQLVVRRDQLPQSVSNVGWSYPENNLTWPTGNSWAGETDWTNRYYDAGNNIYLASRRLVMATGAPLEPGTYFVGIYNADASNPTSYTFESRGIGSGQSVPVNSLAYSGGSNTITALPPREAAYYKVTIPANTPSWNFTLTPSVGEMMMCVRRAALPDFRADYDYYDIQQTSYSSEVRVQKSGPERYVLLPPNNQDFIVAGDYFIVAVSEGVSPADASHTGTGTSSGVITSDGPLATTNLGTASLAGLTQPVSLESGQLKNYSFTVPAGTASLEVRLDNRTGNPNMGLVSGTRVATRYPGYGLFGYGYGGGQISGTVAAYDDDLITVANPAAGSYNITLRADPLSGNYPAATADLVIIANAPVPVAFDGSSTAISNQAGTAWRYFQVTVPPGVLGWDVRVKNVTGTGNPQLVVRRDQLPQSVSNVGWSYPENNLTWPTGNSWAGETDWTNRYYDAGNNIYLASRRLVMATGAPLEPGTYFVGIYNADASNPTSYTFESRGIGSGQSVPVNSLAYSGGSNTITALPPREAAYYKVTIPANTPSWEFTLAPSAGEMMMCVRRAALPDFRADYEYYDIQQTSYSSEVRVQKAGPERFVLLPPNNQDFIVAGDYYIAAVSEGVNPSDGSHTGTGTSSGMITSNGPLATPNLGAATLAGITQPISLQGGQLKNYRFSVPAGTASLEVRLDSRVGNPNMGLISGDRTATRYPGYGLYGYGYGGGQINSTVATYDDDLITVSNPPPGNYNITLRADSLASAYPDATADLVIRQIPRLPLNYAASLNGNGLSHTATRQLLDTQKDFFEVAVPTTLSGQPVVGWLIKVENLQGDTTLKIYKTWGTPGTGITVNGNSALVVPPFLTPGDTWFIEVAGTGLTQYTITSQPITLERPVWTMPAGHNTTFGDSGNDSGGNPLPGDRGVDIGLDDWHFFAVDVPAGNAGLLRTELQAINGNPNLYIREDGVPTTDHMSNGVYGTSLINRSLTSTASEYGNWVPLDGRYENQLRAGRWYLGVKATGASNARYRLKVSTGQVTDLALNGGSVTNQILVGRDWRYYRFTVPADAPDSWNLTFSQQVGDVNMWLRDTIPPGNNTDGLETTSTTYNTGLRTWSSDNKNQGPYSNSGQDAAGTYPFGTPPLRPGHTYYVGFRAANDATFSFSSATGGGTIGVLPLLAFYNGTINTSVPAGGSVLYRIPVPPEATRMKWTSTHASAVQLRLEQGTLPATTGTQHWTSGSGTNLTFNQSLTNPNGWPWQPDHDYYLRLYNSSGASQTVTLTMDGKNAATEDEDNDGLPDAWEILHFANIYSYNGTSDPDGDGVTNAVEFTDGTIPNNVTSAKYFLTITPYAGSTVKAPVLAKYDRGTTVNLTDTPLAGRAFLGWQRVGNYADDFVVRITGTVTIPSSGTYTFGTNSSDGVRLKINGTDVITKDIYYAQTDDFGQVTLAAGTYPLELTGFEYSGGEALELFAAAGSHSAFNANFKLLGDTASGGLAVQTMSGPSTVPGLTVQQILAVGTGNIYSLARMDELLAGTRAKRAEATRIAPMINHLGSGSADGHFMNNAFYPLQQLETDNPLALDIYGDYTLAALNGITLAEAVDAPALSFTTGGEAPWIGELSALAFDNVDHAGSGPIVHNQSSSFSTTVVGPGTLTFRWKVSSEVNYDNLQFMVNNSVNQQISGEQSYPLVTYAVPAGTQKLTWRYTKNGSVNSGSDRGWVDQINWVPAGFDYAAWRAANFTPAEVANNLISGPNADPDNDGLKNVIEFGFGLLPKSGSSLGLPQGQTIGGNYVVTFTQPAGIINITYGAQWSTTLSPGSWNAIPDTGGGGATHTFSVPTAGKPKLFIRHVVTIP